MRKIAYVAADPGPRATLEPLAEALPGWWPKAASADELRAGKVELLVCGTSDSSAGRKVEVRACSAANALQIPLVAIEDFPGNYCDTPAGRPQLLVVDSEFSGRLALARTGGAALNLCVVPCVRYDPLRRRLEQLRQRSAPVASHCVLWAGQPETADALKTLAVLVPALRDHGAVLWFRAHPRDAGYARGAYRRLLEEISSQTRDLTASNLETCLAARPSLVVTQFSSVAVEAGFWGIPALHILLPGAGATRLAAKKGYAVPPWCEAGAAFLVTEAAQMDSALRLALGSQQARSGVQDSFDRYFEVRRPGAPVLVDVLYNHGFL